MADDVASSDSAQAPSSLPFDVNERNRRGYTLLHRAVIKGRLDVVESLLENPDFLMLNAGTPAGETALHFAASTGQMRIVELLLKNPNTNVNVKSRGRKACDMAATTGNKDIEAAILSDRRYRDDIKINPKLTKGQRESLRKKENRAKPLLETGNLFAAGDRRSQLIVATTHGQAGVAASVYTGGGTYSLASWNAPLPINSAQNCGCEPSSALVRVDTPTPRGLMCNSSHADVCFPSSTDACITGSEATHCSGLVAEMLKQLPLEGNEVDEETHRCANLTLSTRRKLRNLPLAKPAQSVTQVTNGSKYNKIPKAFV